MALTIRVLYHLLLFVPQGIVSSWMAGTSVLLRICGVYEWACSLPSGEGKPEARVQEKPGGLLLMLPAFISDLLRGISSSRSLCFWAPFVRFGTLTVKQVSVLQRPRSSLSFKNMLTHAPFYAELQLLWGRVLRSEMLKGVG